MRFKIYLSVVIILCAYSTKGFTIKETDKIASKEWHCTNICKSCYGVPNFDKITEKCYCSLSKGNSIEDKNCRDAMRLNAKIYELHLILKEISEISNRVRREEPVTEKDIQNTSTKTVQPVTVTTETVTTEGPGPIVAAESNSETTTSKIETIPAVKGIKIKGNKNTIERKARPFPKSIGRGKATTAANTQDKQIDDLVAAAQQKVEEFVVIHRQNPKEAQNKIKDIQGTFSKVASRLKHNNEPPTLQERISHIEERFAARKTTTPATLIVEPENLINDTENNAVVNTIVGSRRHPIIHRQRIPLLRRITINNENEERSKLKTLNNENEEDNIRQNERIAHHENEENIRLRPKHHHENDENIRLRPRLIPRSRFRDRVAATRNQVETTTQIIAENTPINETTTKNTEQVEALNILPNTKVETDEINPVNNEI